MLPDILQWVSLPVIPLETCRLAMQRDYSPILESHICAGLEEGGKDSCQGDSGGPFVCMSANSTNKYVLAGVVSWGFGCANPGTYGIYTGVSYYLDFVQRAIEEADFTTGILLFTINIRMLFYYDFLFYI